jgi:tetratricopeptide (TPR) repeat protein
MRTTILAATVMVLSGCGVGAAPIIDHGGTAAKPASGAGYTEGRPPAPEHTQRNSRNGSPVRTERRSVAPIEHETDAERNMRMAGKAPADELSKQAMAAFNAGKIDEAIKTCERITRLYPRNGVGYYDLSLIFTSKRNFALAETNARNAMKFAGPHFDYLLQLGNVLIEERKLDEAEKILNRAKLVAPTEDDRVFAEDGLDRISHLRKSGK